jgi:hypothetical protein
VKDNNGKVYFCEESKKKVYEKHQTRFPPSRESFMPLAKGTLKDENKRSKLHGDLVSRMRWNDKTGRVRLLLLALTSGEPTRPDIF